MPRRGYPNTAPGTGCARSTATNPGTTSHGPTPSITVARLCTPTLRRIQGCSDDHHAQHRPGVNTITTRAEDKIRRRLRPGRRPSHGCPDRRGRSNAPTETGVGSSGGTSGSGGAGDRTGGPAHPRSRTCGVPHARHVRNYLATITQKLEAGLRAEAYRIAQL